MSRNFCTFMATVLLSGTLFAAQPVPVPFVGCPSDGQQGPQPAPKSPRYPVLVDAALAPGLAYYAAGMLGVLGPRGWHCFGSYGSSGAYLFVSPSPELTKTLSQGAMHYGSVVIVSYNFGDTSGRYTVADVIARLFPSHIAFVRRMIERSDLPKDFRVIPYSGDTFTAKSDRIVQFSTVPNQAGLGIALRLKPSHLPVDGIAILVGDTPDLLQVIVRVEPQLTSLKPHILRQVEIDARRLAER